MSELLVSRFTVTLEFKLGPRGQWSDVDHIARILPNTIYLLNNSCFCFSCAIYDPIFIAEMPK